MALWNLYHAWAEPLEQQRLLRRPIVPANCVHNAHMYYLLLPSLEARTHFIERLKEQGIGAVFHYIPLHSSPAGKRLGRTHGSMSVTDDTSDRLVRLPLWVGLEPHMEEIFDAARRALMSSGPCGSVPGLG